MRRTFPLLGGLVLCAIVAAFLLLKVSWVTGALRRLEAQLADEEAAHPGLGEYMTTIQLHAGKLWFAAQATN